MNRIIVILLIFATSLASYSQSLVEQADSAYTADDFAAAADLYRRAMDDGGTSSEVLYNLGNCYYRLGEPGNAILMYERALRIDPTNADARENLAFVNSKITDRPGERGTFLSNASDAIALKLRPDTWAWIAFGLFALIIAGVVIYVFSSSIVLRKIGFFGAIVCLILCVASLLIALRASAIATADDKAIVIKPSTILSTAPRTPSDRSLEAMLLHEGTKVVILDSVMNRSDSIPVLWLDVEVDNTHRAWIDARDVERI